MVIVFLVHRKERRWKDKRKKRDRDSRKRNVEFYEYRLSRNKRWRKEEKMERREKRIGKKSMRGDRRRNGKRVGQGGSEMRE